MVQVISHSRESRLSDHQLLSKVKSTEYLEKSLTVGSKRRLWNYQKDLVRTTGLDSDFFDSQIWQLLCQYGLNKSKMIEVKNYLDSVHDSDGFKFSRNLKQYQKIEDSLKQFASPDHPSFRWNKNYQLALKELKDEFSHQRFEILNFNSDGAIKEALPKESTHSGYYYIISGKKLKGDNIAGSYCAFQNEKEIALKEGSFNKPIMLGFRTQASGELDDDGSYTYTCKHKTRMVSMYDLMSIINELRYSIAIQNYMALRPSYAGGKDAHEISSVLTSYKVRYRYYFSIDYSSFDSTISSWLIEDAFDILRSGFKNMSSEDETLFDIMVNDFINKSFILNEGILRVNRGVPSGSMFTQIIDSIVNELVIKTYFIAMKQKADMCIMGDDNCIFTNYDTSIDSISTYVMKNFGLIVKLDMKTKVGRTDAREGIKFLSRYWRFDGQYRNPYQLLSRLLFPERFRNYGKKDVTPELVVYAFILTYPLGMHELIDTVKFLSDNSSLKKQHIDILDSRYLPGSLAFIKEYTRRRSLD